MPASASLWTFWETPREFNDAITNYTRVVISLDRTTAECCLVHSCAVQVPGRAVALFYGPSGAGKSTLGSLAVQAGRTVLSDDLNAVSIDDGGVSSIRGYPWSGDYGPRSWTSGRSLPLGAIVRLEKAERHEIAPLRPSVALAGLAGCSPFANSEPELYGRLLEKLERLVAGVPAYTLRFRPDPGLWKLVDEVLP